MKSFPSPTVVQQGDQDDPLVVLLHGRGSNERDIFALTEHLPRGANYAAVRAPIAEGPGYAWFLNRGVGRPLPESLAETTHWFRSWLDAEAPPNRPVILIGFSGGTAFAGGLILQDPTRFAGAALLYGTIPFEAGVPVSPDLLKGLQVFIAHGDDDHVIPRDLLTRTWAYLTLESGATITPVRDPGGHAISANVAERLSRWLETQLASLNSVRAT